MPKDKPSVRMAGQHKKTPSAKRKAFTKYFSCYYFTKTTFLEYELVPTLMLAV